MTLPHAFAISPGAVARFSFLAPNPGLTPSEFSWHYEHVHGPLAAAQDGFRKYTRRYDQNHVTHRIAGGAVEAAGITMTVQEPREDYRTGFFQEPDYLVVQQDERYLLDIQSTRSLLARLVSVSAASPNDKKVMVTGRAEHVDTVAASSLVTGHRRWDLTPSSATALGFGDVPFSADALAELWTADALGLADTITGRPETGLDAWAVRELTMIPLQVDPIDARDIAELKAAYCRYVDTKAWPLLPRLFTADAEFGGFAFDVSSVQVFTDSVASFLRDVRTVHQVFAPEMRALAPDRIRATWVMQDILRWAPGSRDYRGLDVADLAGINGYGHYEDEYVRTSDGWRIAYQCLTRLYVEPVVQRHDATSQPNVRALTPGWLDPREVTDGAMDVR